VCVYIIWNKAVIVVVENNKKPQARKQALITKEIRKHSIETILPLKYRGPFGTIGFKIRFEHLNDYLAAFMVSKVNLFTC
jgi:hypothetical protein